MKQPEFIDGNGFIAEVNRTNRRKSADIRVEEGAVSVVVDELCHLIRHDHSRQFWGEVGRVLPDFEECRDWLKRNGHVMVVL